MKKIKLDKTKFNDVSRVRFLIILLVIVIIVSFAAPSLARYKHYINLEAMLNKIQTWDGSVATSYNSGSGTEDDPYIIMNASQFAYFAQSVNNGEDYKDTYFKLGNHIVLNNGIFGFNNDIITYTVDEQELYIKEYTSEVYENDSFDGSSITNINLFDSISEFDGHFDGDYYTIYGLYISDEDNEVALFKELNGTFNNAYFKNAMVYGGASTAVLANNVLNTEIVGVSVDGFVIGDNGVHENSLVVEQSDLILTIEEDYGTAYSDLDLDLSDDYEILEIKLSGYVEENSAMEIAVAGKSITAGEFNVSLGKDTRNIEFYISSDNKGAMATFTDLKIEYVYNYPISGGLVAYASYTTFNNVINKADVYGENIGGLIGIGSNIVLSNSYNKGELNGTKVSAIVNQISNNTVSTINKVYNIGIMNGTLTSIVGDLINSEHFSITNSFNAQKVINIVNTLSGDVSFDNVYDINLHISSSDNVLGEVTYINKNNINKEFLVNTLGFYEYVDNEDMAINLENIWVYEKEDYPILYMDELNNPIASLNVGVYSWNDLGYVSEELKFTQQQAFNVTLLNEFTDVDEIYYFIHNSDEELNKESVNNISDWIEYKDVVSLNEEGRFIIYVKMIDSEDNVYYVNSDVLIFDLKGPNIELKLNENVWTSFKDTVDNVYISEPSSIEVVINDTYSDVIDSYYFISNKYLNYDDVEEMEQWEKLDENIEISTKGVNIVYVKSIDSNNHVNIINTDYIVYGGYEESLYIGNESVDIANITDSSLVTYKFNFEGKINYSDGYNTNLVLSDKLPKGTRIKFIDHDLNGVYGYIVEDDRTVIRLNDFSKLGSIYNNSINEVVFLSSEIKEINVIFDFELANVVNDFSFNASLSLMDKDNNVILSTVKETIKNTNVYGGFVNEVSLTKINDLNEIVYNSNSTNTIYFEYSINSLLKKGILVNDTNRLNMKSGIAISLVDDKGKIVSKDYLKNLEFVYNGKNYFANSDGIVRINVNDKVDDVVGKINVITYENELNLDDGTYKLILKPYIAYDGIYYSDVFDSNISIDVIAEQEFIGDYEFNVKMEDSSKILIKDMGDVVIPFEVLSTNSFESSSVRVSLYKKKKNDANNQEYELIDVQNYSKKELTLIGDRTYEVKGNIFELELDLSTLDKQGYEIRFELYDGNKKIDVIKKKILVK